MIAILGGLGAAAAWAASTVCSSRSSRRLDPASVLAWVMVVGLLITVPLVAARGVPSDLDGRAAAWLAAAGVGNVGGLLCAYRALRIGQVALIAPLLSTEGAIAAVVAVVAGESLAPGVGLTLAGMAVGVALASVPAVEAPGEVGGSHYRVLGYAAAAALLFGLSLYAAGRAGELVPSIWVVLAARVVGTFALALPLALSGRLHYTGDVAPLLLISGVCEVLGFLSYTAGARHGIAIAAVLSSQFGTLAAIAGYVLFRERLSRVQLTGVAVVVVSVAVLSALRA